MKFIYIFILAVLLFSCERKEAPKDQPVLGSAKVAAIFTNPDGTKDLHIGKRVIKATAILVDSTSMKWDVRIDTLWGIPVNVAFKDSLGQIVRDSTGQIKIAKEPGYLEVSKDSVYWQIEGKDIDSLLKKKQ